MPTDEQQIQHLIDLLHMDEGQSKDLFEFFMQLRNQGVHAFPANFILRRPEYLHDRFLFNRVYDFTSHLEPRMSWEILNLEEEALNPMKTGMKAYISHFPNNPSEPVLNQKFEKKSELKALSNKVSELETIVKDLKLEIERVKEQNEDLKETIYNQILFSGRNTKEQIQNIPVEVYLDTDNSTEILAAYQAIIDFLETIEFEKSIEFKPVKGSWFKRFIAKSKAVITDKEVTDRLKEAEYGVEVNTILKPQSEIDKNHSEALCNILKSIESIPNAAIRIGSLIVVKVTNITGEASIQVRTLSIKELHLLNKKPELLSKPAEVLIALAKEIENSNSSENILQN